MSAPVLAPNQRENAYLWPPLLSSRTWIASGITVRRVPGSVTNPRASVLMCHALVDDHDAGDGRQNAHAHGRVGRRHAGQQHRERGEHCPHAVRLRRTTRAPPTSSSGSSTATPYSQ